MKKTIGRWGAFLILMILLAACDHGGSFGNEIAGESTRAEKDESIQTSDWKSSAAPVESGNSNESYVSLPEGILESYYAGKCDPAFEYFQKSRIQKFLAMWVKEETGDIEDPEWDYSSFTKIRMLDHDLLEIRPEETLYCCTFSDSSGRYGYIIVAYYQDGPAISNFGVTETTPYVYDLNANMEKIYTGLMKTDIDLMTAKAERIYLFDKERIRADQAICFTDGKGDCYICYFGESSFEVEKWKAAE